jgi:hypothetical protein
MTDGIHAPNQSIFEDVLMIMRLRGGGRFPSKVIALILGTWIIAGPSTVAGDWPAGPTKQESQKGGKGQPGRRSPTFGAPGRALGYYGFGLGYHLGYGYGGDALGVGADGGYPFYGGPGYRHCEPVLRRVGGITPFPYFGGSGYPTPSNPNYFGAVGALVDDQPVVTSESDLRDSGSSGGYGLYNGTLPYPETTFAPFSGMSTIGRSSGGASPGSVAIIPTNTAQAAGDIPDEPASDRHLGIDVERVIDADRARGLKITRVQPGSAAEKAGLVEGDVILMVNGYLTKQSRDLAWIIANAVPRDVLKLSVRTARDGEVRTITAH